MKGNNTLKLNQNTMVAIVQRWVNAEIPNAKPEVSSVLAAPDGAFVINVKERPRQDTEALLAKHLTGHWRGEDDGNGRTTFRVDGSLDLDALLNEGKR
jgi:hypothetical protein